MALNGKKDRKKNETNQNFGFALLSPVSSVYFRHIVIEEVAEVHVGDRPCIFQSLLDFPGSEVFNYCIIQNTTEWSFCPAFILPFLLSFLEISGKYSKATHTLSPTGWSNAINILLYFLGFPP